MISSDCGVIGKSRSGVVAVRYADTCRFVDADDPGQAFGVGGGVLKGDSDC